jgi:hypothetical protein
MSVIGKTNVYIVPQGSMKCLYFNGVNNYVDGKSPLSIVNSYSVVVWFKRQGNPQGSGDNSYHTLIQSISGYNVQPRLLVFASGSSILLQQIDNAGNTVNLGVSNQPLGDNQFHQIVGTFDGSTMKIFVDGIYINSTSCNGMKTGSTNYRIGAYTTIGTYQANGIISDVRVYNRALLDSEITTLYNGGDVWNGLVLYLPGYGILEDQNKWWDFSGNGNHGTIYGAKVVWNRIR